VGSGRHFAESYTSGVLTQVLRVSPRAMRGLYPPHRRHGTPSKRSRLVSVQERMKQGQLALGR
jgi:hypothetical protein